MNNTEVKTLRPISCMDTRHPEPLVLDDYPELKAAITNEDGSLNKEQVMAHLTDYANVNSAMGEIVERYCPMLSPFYKAYLLPGVLKQIEEHISTATEYAIRDYLKDHDLEVDEDYFKDK